MRNAAVGAVVVCSVTMAGAADGVAQDRDRLVFGAAWYDVLSTETAAAARAEYRLGYGLWWRVKPFVGIMATSDHAVFLHGGFYADLPLGDYFPGAGFLHSIVATPVAGFGYYDEGDGKDLGSHHMFRIGIELAHEFDSGLRIGATFYHLSNADTAKANPGTEILGIFASLPIGGPRGGPLW